VIFLNTNNSNQATQTGKAEKTSYREVKHGKVLYRVTSIYKGEFELGKALEDLTVKKVLRSASPLFNTEC